MNERVDPPLQADERTTLLAFLHYFRTTLALKVDGLTDEQARRRAAPPSDLSLTGLGDAHPDGDLHPGADDTLAEALGTWRRKIAAADVIVGDLDPDHLAARDAGWGRERPGLRWILVHMIEEYARHCGHADLLREAIDGATGD